MKSGQLRERIGFERRYEPTGTDTAGNPILETDTSGQLVDDWTPYLTVKARVHPVSGRELLQTGATLAPYDTRFLIRWSPLASAIDTTFRIIDRGVIYNIVSVANVDMRNREIEILARSGENRG